MPTRLVGQMSVLDAIAADQRAVREARRSRDRPVQAAGHDDALHFGGVFCHVLQERAPQQSAEKAQVVEEDRCGDTRSRRGPTACIASTALRAAARRIVVGPGPGGPRADNTASWPGSTARRSLTLRGSPCRTVTRSASAPNLCGERTNAVISCPRSTAWLINARPVPPLAPSINSRMACPLRVFTLRRPLGRPFRDR